MESPPNEPVDGDFATVSDGSTPQRRRNTAVVVRLTPLRRDQSGGSDERYFEISTDHGSPAPSLFIAEEEEEGGGGGGVYEDAEEAQISGETLLSDETWSDQLTEEGHLSSDLEFDDDEDSVHTWISDEGISEERFDRRSNSSLMLMDIPNTTPPAPDQESTENNDETDAAHATSMVPDGSQLPSTEMSAVQPWWLGEDPKTPSEVEWTRSSGERVSEMDEEMDQLADDERSSGSPLTFLGKPASKVGPLFDAAKGTGERRSVIHARLPQDERDVLMRMDHGMRGKDAKDDDQQSSDDDDDEMEDGRGRGIPGCYIQTLLQRKREARDKGQTALREFRDEMNEKGWWQELTRMEAERALERRMAWHSDEEVCRYASNQRRFSGGLPSRNSIFND